MMEEKQTFSRETAKICPLNDLIKGEYVIQEGWQPNYVLVGLRKISRINILGVVVEKTSKNQFFVDDGTASIQVIDFNQSKNTELLQVGDPVIIIGRPRKTEDELFIASEIVSSDQLKKQPQWLSLRKRTLSSLPKTEIVKEEIKKEEIKKEDEVKNKPKTQTTKFLSEQLTGDDVVDFIKKKDSGEGVLIDELIQYFGQDADEVVLTLLSMGEVYEIKPGKIKILE